MTGAPMPDGADAIVMVERTARDDGDDGVLVTLAVDRRAATCGRAGGDLEAGDVVFRAGTVLGPAHLGVLASVGVGRGARVPACARRRAVDRRRAGGDRAARAGQDPRLQPPDAARASSPTPVPSRRPRHRRTTTPTS